MDEYVLKEFFVEKANASALRESLGGAVSRTNSVKRYKIKEMDDSFEVVPIHLIKVCDAYLEGELLAEDLQSIGFCLISSESFFWDGEDADGEKITRVASDWATPEINYPLNAENVERWRRYLLGEDWKW